jgi:hypothetical protein
VPHINLICAAPSAAGMLERMCRNITELRGLEPAATAEEITAAARQYVRKVSGITRPSDAVAVAFETAVADVAATTTRLLAELPARRQPPKTIPPLRRPEVRARIGTAGPAISDTAGPAIPDAAR